MEQFDIKKFNEHKKGTNWQFVKPDGTKVLQTEYQSGYVEKTSTIDSPYSYYKEFDLQGRLVLKMVEFYRNFVGKRTYFDPATGKIIKEEDYDKDFTFSIDDLTQKMEKEFHFDIMNKNETFYVTRVLDDSNGIKAFYEVYQIKDKMSYQAYLIDGNNGQLLYTITIANEGDDRQPYEEYLKRI